MATKVGMAQSRFAKSLADSAFKLIGGNRAIHASASGCATISSAPSGWRIRQRADNPRGGL